jgi:hypothetical protein
MGFITGGNAPPFLLEPKMSHVEGGRGKLTAAEAAALRRLLEQDERAVLRIVGITKTALYRAAAEQSVHSGTRHAIRSTVLAV